MPRALALAFAAEFREVLGVDVRVDVSPFVGGAGVVAARTEESVDFRGGMVLEVVTVSKGTSVEAVGMR